MSEPVLRSTPLRGAHERRGASFTDFGGWWMPVRYTSDLAEHHAVRTAAGLFDVSHMAEFVVEGPGAGAFLDAALAGRLSVVPVGRATYTLLLAETGGIVDDLIVYRLADQRYLVVANAGNHDAVAAALEERMAGFEASVVDASDQYALIALQGPAAAAVMDAVALTDLGRPLAELSGYSVTQARFEDAPLLVARTGYTGEDGFELYIGAAHAEGLWEAMLAAGAPLGLVPAGLAARDTLRLEAGMPLYGHELSLDVLPVQAGLARVVASDKDAFVGGAALAAIVDPGARVLVGLSAEGRRAARAGYAVLAPGADADLVAVGEVTSGALSPTLGHPIAMAYVDPRVSAPGTTLFVDVRGTPIPATVTPLPFYRRKK
ncbi:MAG: glycine cleavage system aminomethyltransferase GcvT [Microbacterium sp.]|uniref:glycine cleavage system aminomethyltransferase GcvT n=1 Tax=unclassified Microbacterium TaxID=2609290 RepID=UPI000DB77285|nr:glycine cleavage system aminomethyltransferase GcvT [Microbacterium sp.]PZU39602.1 MAG: glycine cleavage system aminomethyltransferase GcvT [Microbacterium sp.]